MAANVNAAKESTVIPVCVPFLLATILAACLCLAGSASAGSPSSARPEPVVEIEEDVYTYQPADNGAGPMWSYGSSCIARVGDEVFISGLETLPDAKPANNVRWQLFHRGDDGWDLVRKGEARTREPCPLVSFPDGTLFLSDNPTSIGPDEGYGPARPEMFVFSAADPTADPEKLVPVWEGEPPFSEHSYRSFAADGKNREFILFQNIGYGHAEWTFRNSAGEWAKQGKLKWPWGAEYPEPQPIRVCYPAVALKDRAVYFCGVSDIVEPYPEWREYKKEVTGREWDYDFRRLFFTWSDNITTGEFHDWIEVSSRDKTCGWVSPCDLWVGPDGAVHLLWVERAIDERLREKFFPEEKQSNALMYAVLRDGEITLKQAIVMAKEGEAADQPQSGRFHVTADGRLFVFFSVRADRGEAGSQPENRLVEIGKDGALGEPVTVALEHPFGRFYTATGRIGCEPSDVMDVYGTASGGEDVLRYARIRLK